jgi:hypothetical protein
VARRTVVRLAALLTGCLAIVRAPPALSSDAGRFAADQVSQSSYDAFLRDHLFTRTGHARDRTGEQHHPCRDNVLSLFQSYGLLAYLDPFMYSGYQGWNVVGEIRGTKHPTQVYIVGGHYDSVANPGADDNASGVALTLEAARILSQYPADATIRFMAFDLEEVGLFGSRSYVQRYGQMDVRGMISADMVAYDRGSDYACIYGRPASDAVKQALAAAVTTYGSGLHPLLRGASDSTDHAPFEWAGKPACALGEFGPNPHYHTYFDCYDTPDYLNFAYGAKMTRAVVGWLVDSAGVRVFGVGDMNCDGQVSFGDIERFVEALRCPGGQGWQHTCPWINADVNEDGQVNFADINPFVALLSA